MHVSIPSSPQPLEDIKMDIVFGDIVELTPVGILRSEEKGRGRVPGEQSAGVDG